MTKKYMISLYDYTGLMAIPWAESGYTCLCFDIQHPNGLSDSDVHENIKFVGADLSTENARVVMGGLLLGANIGLVAGFPPCTDLAVSGAGRFANKRSKDPEFQSKAMDLVYFVGELGESLGVPWFLENPVSVISTMWRKPGYMFHPYEYGAYLPEDDVHPEYPEMIPPRDAYPKKTCLWTSESFIMPPKRPVESNGDFIMKLGGKSTRTKNIRSATPRGFAQAVFLSNHIEESEE